MTYRDQTFNRRFKQMGDEAETKFEEASPYGSSVRYGWNRDASFKFMDPHIRFTPDYYTNNGYLVEVMGCSGDLFRALKVDKWESMKWWNKAQPLLFFIWNSKTRQWILLDFKTMGKAVTKAKKEGRVKAFEVDGNEYYEMDWPWLAERAIDSGT